MFGQDGVRRGLYFALYCTDGLRSHVHDSSGANKIRNEL